jgi:hypothetical protein
LAASQQDAEAEKFLADSLRQRRMQAASPDATLAIGLYYDAMVKHRAGEWAEASDSAKEALQQTVPGSDRVDRLRANILTLLAVLAAENEEYELAEQQFLQAHELMSEAYAPAVEREMLLQRIVEFYQARDRDAEVEKYRKLLEEIAR